MIQGIYNEVQIGDVIHWKDFDNYIHHGGRRRKGIVIDKYEYYCVVDVGYRECVLWVDLILQKGVFYGVSEAES